MLLCNVRGTALVATRTFRAVAFCGTTVVHSLCVTTSCTAHKRLSRFLTVGNTVVLAAAGGATHCRQAEQPNGHHVHPSLVKSRKEMTDDSKGMNNKRQQVDVALPDGLRALMGGRKFCPQEELTREVLLQYLKAKGGIREVGGLLDI